jgi:ferredoxin--NADP+ reductase
MVQWSPGLPQSNIQPQSGSGLGRRGPVQAKFTTKELRELGEIVDCNTFVDPIELALNAESEAELEHRGNLTGPGNLSLFRSFASRKAEFGHRNIRFRFHLSPAALIGDGHVEKIVLTRNLLEGPPFAQIARPTEQIELSCGLVFRSIGDRGVPIPGLPFDESRGTVPHASGRVVDGAKRLEGVYVTGWLKRGPTGIIGTNRADSVETVQCLLAELPKICDREKPGADALRPLLERRGIRVLNYQNWVMIDSAEIDRGKPKGKPREKFTRIHEMLAVSADKSGQSA